MGRKNKVGTKHEPKVQKKVKPNEYTQIFDNTLFKLFYKIQFHDMDEKEFEEFWQSLSRPLPISFRINKSQLNHENLVQKLVDGTLLLELAPEHQLKEVKWYPGSLVWESKLAKKELRKSEQLIKLHQFIQKCNSTGLITRQELVSMLPPLFLNPQPGEFILDMCAAPGSKTFQLLEMQTNHALIIANDVDAKRAYMLSHQLQRMSSAHVIITNYAAQFYPTLTYQGQKLLFDKILCDVPCTGDGAARKLPNRWTKWSCKDGNVIHPLQLSILMRAIQMCKIGGLVMYSTCSLNPVENEAVVAEVFRRGGIDGLELLDVNVLPNFKGRRGMTEWKVLISDDLLANEFYKMEDPIFFGKEFDTSNLIYEINSLNDTQTIKHLYPRFSRKQEGQFQNSLKGLKPSLFSDDLCKKIGLEKTMRVLPHDQDTGGFYLAMFRKTANVVWKKPHYSEHIIKPKEQIIEEPQNKNQGQVQEQVQEIIQEDVQEQQLKQNGKNEELPEQVEIDNVEIEQLLKRTEEEVKGNDKNKKDKSYKQEQYQVINEYDWKVICDYYGIDETKFLRQQVLGTGQTGDPLLQSSKRFRFVSQEVYNIINEPKNADLKIINIGCKVFERGKDSFGGQVTPFKISQEGINYVLPYITKRKIQCSKEEFLDVVNKKTLKIEECISEHLKESIAQVGSGSFVLYFNNIVSEAIVCQYYKNSISLMATVEEVENIKIRYM
ncbi:hypothetical protein pb186bvf_018697 [Paramecium bursaria]